MSFHFWSAFAVATLILVIIPGPTVLLVVSYALGKGRRTAIGLVAGVALGDLIAMTVTLMGLGAVMLASATLFSLMKWAGALYLVWLGIGMFRTADSAAARIDRLAHKSERRAALDTMLVTVLNPKSIGFFVAFVPQFIDAGRPIMPQFTIMIITFVTLGSANALAYALLAIELQDRLKRPGLIPAMQRLGGLTLISMAAFTAALRRT